MAKMNFIPKKLLSQNINKTLKHTKKNPYKYVYSLLIFIDISWNQIKLERTHRFFTVSVM